MYDGPIMIGTAPELRVVFRRQFFLFLAIRWYLLLIMPMSDGPYQVEKAEGEEKMEIQCVPSKHFFHHNLHSILFYSISYLCLRRSPGHALVGHVSLRSGAPRTRPLHTGFAWYCK